MYFIYVYIFVYEYKTVRVTWFFFFSFFFPLFLFYLYRNSLLLLKQRGDAAAHLLPKVFQQSRSPALVPLTVLHDLNNRPGQVR